MITGQYVRTHGVTSNGVPLPVDAPSVAEHLHDTVGYRTALVGKAHFQPGFDPEGKWTENCLAKEGSTGPYRGFDHVELAMHGYLRRWHYDKWLEANGPQWLDAFYPLINFASMGLNDEGGGDTDAPEVKHNPMPRGMYHTDWVADRTIAWLDSLDPADDWFCWMSFPDPHHPWDPPVDEVRRRVDWRDLDLPPGHPGSTDKAVEILAQKPHHWLDWYEGRFQNMEGGPDEVRAGEHVPRPGPRGERPHPRGERAHRRGPAAGSWPASTSGAGVPTPTSCSRRTTASSKATSACCSRAPTTWTP